MFVIGYHGYNSITMFLIGHHGYISITNAAKRSLMNQQNQNVKNEQELWHGTPESAVISINLYGFNRSYCTANSSKLCLYLWLKINQHCYVWKLS
jgi:hypothetical protein